MGKQRAAPPPNDNLTISRIHIVLRPFETKLNVLAKTLERKIAEDKYAPKSRQPGITYAKRHRIRAMTGMTSGQAGRAYALEKSKGLSTLYSFHEQLIGVEDAFRNLVRAIPGSQERNVDGKRPRVPTLQAMVCQMIGRQVAEETLRDKEELEAEGVEDCIGLWYGGLSVNCRKHALVAHAVQLVELKIPFFILELWKGLLMITMQAGLHEESYILLEYVLLYYFTPVDSAAADCPAAQMNGRDLTDLYTQLTSLHSLPPAEFFTVLLPIIEASPCAPAIWNFRCLQHLIRNMDGDIILMARIVDSMARTFATAQSEFLSSSSTAAEEQEQNSPTDVARLGILLESKVYFVLALVNGAEEDITSEIVQDIGHLAWTTHHIGKLYRNTLLKGLSLALDTIVLLRVPQKTTSLPSIDVSDALERLGSVISFNGDDTEGEVYTTLVKALYTANPGAFSATSAAFLDNCVATLQIHKLHILAEGLEQCRDGMVERGEHMRLRLVPPPLVSEKRLRNGKENGRSGARKRRKGDAGSEEGDSGASDSDSEIATEWSASVSGEDTAGEQQEEEEEEEDEQQSTDEEETENERRQSSTDDEVDEPGTLESRSINDGDEEEELEDDSDSGPRSYFQPSSHRAAVPSRRHIPPQRPIVRTSRIANPPAPVLRSVVSAKMASELMARLARRTRELERDRARVGYPTSSDDDLDLLGQEAREEVNAQVEVGYGRASARPSGHGRRGYGSGVSQDRWSTP